MASRILEDLNQLVAASYPRSQDEALELWHDIKPVRFGGELSWTVAIEYFLVDYVIPDDAGYLVVTRVDAYITTPTVTAAGYGLKVPITSPSPNTVIRWVAAPTLPAVVGDEFNVTGLEELNRLADVDEFLFFKGGQEIALIADLPANPTADARFLVTTVYAYLLGPKVADKLGSGESLIHAT